MTTENRMQQLNNEEYEVEWTVRDGLHTIRLIKNLKIEGQLLVEQEEKGSWSYTED